MVHLIIQFHLYILNGSGFHQISKTFQGSATTNINNLNDYQQKTTQKLWGINIYEIMFCSKSFPFSIFIIQQYIIIST